jgi:hypothetical protein
MPAVQRLCKTAYLFDKGRIVTSGPAARVVDAYYEMNQDFNPEAPGTRRAPEGGVRFTQWQTKTKAGEPYTCFSGDGCDFIFDLECRREIKQATFGLVLYADDGTLIWSMSNIDDGTPPLVLGTGQVRLRFVASALPLRPGSYQVFVSANDLYDGVLDAWYPRPKLKLAAKLETNMPVNWQGLLNLPGRFEWSTA